MGRFALQTEIIALLHGLVLRTGQAMVWLEKGLIFQMTKGFELLDRR